MVKMLLKAFSCSLLVIVIGVVVCQARTLRSKHKIAKRLGVSAKNGRFKKFYGFVSRYNKDYKQKRALEHRFSVFKNNLKVIKKLNTKERGTAVYGITQFADRTEREFLKTYGIKVAKKKGRNKKKKGRANEEMKFPEDWKPTIQKPKVCDWRSAEPTIVTPIQDQGPAGACWIFAYIAPLESQYQLRNRLDTPAKFSEQEIWDCGTFPVPYPIITKDLNSTLTSAAVYPYTAKKGQCVRDRQPKYQLGTLDGEIIFNKYWDEISKQEPVEDFMARFVAQRGPIVAYVTAGAPLMHYLHGVIDPSNGLCGHTKEFNLTNHAVALIGFGETNDNPPIPYWIAKNSYGEHADEDKVGNKGYWYIYRGKNVCNVAEGPLAIKLLPVEFHETYKAAGCPQKTILPIGKEVKLRKKNKKSKKGKTSKKGNTSRKSKKGKQSKTSKKNKTSKKSETSKKSQTSKKGKKGKTGKNGKKSKKSKRAESH